MIKKLFTVLSLSLALCSNAATITVTNTDDSGAGSLRYSVANASPGDVINFNVIGTITLSSGSITISQGITISGPGASSLTLDGNNTNRIFTITAGTVIINDLTLFHGNTSGKGGGINISGSGSTTINRCVFSSCKTNADGGGIVIGGGNLHLNYCTFDSNHADYDGGGIRVNGGTVSISGCTFSNNTTGYSGAGIREIGGSVTVVNSTLSGNNAQLNGGGFQGNMTLINCTISDNSATSSGGGGMSSSATFTNCIIYGNTCSDGPDIKGSFNSNGVNIIGNTSGSSGASGADIIGIDPLLGPLTLNGGITKTYAIPLTSVAINAGSNCCNTPSTDQRDSIRGCNPDIGAFENTDANTTIQSIDTHVACESFTWIDGNTYTTSNSTAKDTLTSVSGCDSVVTLNLTIHPMPDNSTTQTDGIHLSSNSNGNNYQWIDCDNGSALIAGATNKDFTATANGNYAVIIDNGNCIDTSNCIAVSTVGLKNFNQDTGIKIFPNPTKNKVTVQSDMSIKSLEIYNLVGRKVLSVHPGVEKTQLNIGQLTPALYLMKIQTKDGKMSTVKLIKK